MSAREQQITIGNDVQITLINDKITIDYRPHYKVTQDEELPRITLHREYHAVVENIIPEDTEVQEEAEPTKVEPRAKRTRKADG